MARLQKISDFHIIKLKENAALMLLRYISLLLCYARLSLIYWVLCLCDLVPSGTASLSANMGFGVILLNV